MILKRVLNLLTKISQKISKKIQILTKILKKQNLNQEQKVFKNVIKVTLPKATNYQKVHKLNQSKHTHQDNKIF